MNKLKYVFSSSIVITILIVLTGFTTRGQEKKVTVLPVPAIGYSPETKTYLGAVSLFTFKSASDSLTRTSNAGIEFNYTFNKQIILETGWNYFSPGENLFSRGLIHYSKYPDKYYGIGFNTPEADETNFQSNRFIVSFDIFRKIKNNAFVGFGAGYKSYNNLEISDVSTVYPELVESRTYSVKAIFLRDTRNNILSPSEGNYFEFNNSFNFSSSFYFGTIIDFRKYISGGKKDRHVWAGRFYQSTIWGNPPFYGYNLFGGDGLARGYYLGRFRDKSISSVQLEYRIRLFWRLGLATFGGVSALYKNLHNIESESFKPNAGMGLRFLVDKSENTNLRLDYAVGADNQSGFYISFGESF